LKPDLSYVEGGGARCFRGYSKRLEHHRGPRVHGLPRCHRPNVDAHRGGTGSHHWRRCGDCLLP
jgi:hypothetical protein